MPTPKLRNLGKSRATSSSVTEDEPVLMLPSSSENEKTPDTSECQKCTFIRDCVTKSPPRKVVSHIFGRNKQSTKQIPVHVWVWYCRKHYQRGRYRTGNCFFYTQITLVKDQLNNMEDWGAVQSWEIALRRAENDKMVAEDKLLVERGSAYDAGIIQAYYDDEKKKAQAKATSTGKKIAKNDFIPCQTRFLQEHLGKNKTFEDVRAVVDLIEAHWTSKTGDFPECEFLANIPEMVETRVRRRNASSAASATTATSAATSKPAVTAISAAHPTSPIAKRRRLVQGTRTRDASQS